MFWGRFFWLLEISRNNDLPKKLKIRPQNMILEIMICKKKIRPQNITLDYLRKRVIYRLKTDKFRKDLLNALSRNALVR